MILGSHNSMTFSKPDNWFIRLFSWMYKCQDNDIKRQYDNGCRCFDLRVRYKKNDWIFAHGLFQSSEYSIWTILNKLNGLSVLNNENIYIRLVLEIPWHNKKQEEEFIKLCKECVNRYYNKLVFFEARRKYDWLQLWNFGNYPTVMQYVGSMQSWWGKLFPRIWSAIYKKKYMFNAQHRGEGTICLFDFI